MIGTEASSQLNVSTIPTDYVLAFRGDSLSDIKSGNNLAKQSAASVMLYTADNKGVEKAAWNFDGVNRCHETTNTVDLRGTDKVSISFWLKSSSNINDNVVFEYSTNNNYCNAFIGVLNISGNTGFFGLNDHNAGYNLKRINTVVNDGNWHHLVCLSDRSQNGINQISHYVDGIYQSGTTIGAYNADLTGMYSTLYKIFIGARNGGMYNFNGCVCKFKLYARLLSQDEADALSAE